MLICPKTKNRITIDAANNVAKVEQSEISYPIRSGIIDFLPDAEDRISRAYDSIAPSYDDYANLSSLKWKLFTLLAWGSLDDKALKALTEEVLSSIPDDFDGVLLDVPIGTGIATVSKYRKLKKASIIALDYSFGMLEKAQQSYAENGIENVTFIRGDVGNLPIDHTSIDLCLSMAGFHAFSDKSRALHEIVRVLKPGRIFSGCFYIKGKRLLTDLFIRHVLSRGGYFSAPFYDERESLSIFGEYFDIDYSATTKFGGIFFVMNKKN